MSVAAKHLYKDVAVCSFISPADLPKLTGQIRTIINARPDAEEPGQPRSSQMARAARLLGMEYVHIPVVPGQIFDAQIAAFAKVLRDKPGLVLAYCRSGARAASLWALARVAKLGPKEVLEATVKAGFDLHILWARLEARTAA